MKLWMIAALALLAACGVDGEPEPPEPPESRAPAGVTISGEARFGIVREW
jgi:hypothetical protein